MSIDIYNPKELPFGSLSNNAVYLMNIEDEEYYTVTNYIYANLLNSKDHFNVLKNINTKDIYKYFNTYEIEILTGIIVKSLRRAVDEKFKDERLKDILLATESYPIVYISDDPLLGQVKVQDKNHELIKGKNLLGRFLMDIRDSILLKEGKKEKDLYNAYVAYTILEIMIIQHKDDLRSFEGLNIEEIINKYTYSLAQETSKVDLSTLSYDKIIDKYKYLLPKPDKNFTEFLITGGNIKILQLLEESINRPFILSLFLKNKHLSDVRNAQLRKIKNSIFNIYVDNIIKLNFPGLVETMYEEAKNQEFNKMNGLELDLFKDQIYEFYKQNLLPPNVMEKIKNTVDMTLISETAVKNAEEFDIEYMYSTFAKKDNLIITFEANSTVDQTPFFVFSPFSYFEMIKIDGLMYPTIMHYIVANLFANLPEIGNIKDAHKYLLYNPDGDVDDSLNYSDYDNLFILYEDEKYNQSVRLRKKLATVGINKKFEDIGLQELLITTGKNDLIWKEQNDDILGVGFAGNGENFIGNYLQELREKFKNNEDNIENIKEDDITKIMENDIFMRSWLEMRLNDICKIVNEIKDYTLKKHGRDITIDTSFITDVLNYIYQPCNDLININNIKSTPPSYFSELIIKCFKLKKDDSKDIVDLLWNRIIVLIYFVLKNITPKLKNVKRVLAKVELLVSNKTRCVEIIDNSDDNCILSAIINILNKLKEFNTLRKYTNIKTTNRDVETAVNIILNKNMKYNDSTIPAYESFIQNDNVLNVGNFTNTDFQGENELSHGQIKELGDELGENDVEFVFEDENESDEEEIDYPYEEGGYDTEYGNDSGDVDGAKYKVYRKTKAEKERWEVIQAEIFKDLENKQRIIFKKYKNANKLNIYLDTIKIDSDDNNKLSEYIIDAVRYIKDYKMSKKVKNNRINFFATTL